MLSSYSPDPDPDPSPPTFKRPQRARQRRKQRPAPSPPADLTQWRLVNSAAGARLGRAEEPPDAGARGRGAREAPGEGGGAAAGEARAEAWRTGVEPAGAAGWEAPYLWDECIGGGQASGEAAQGVEAQQDDSEPLFSLTPLTRSTTSIPHGSQRRRSAVNDENLPPSTSRPRARRTTSTHEDEDGALPASLDKPHILPRTRRARSRTRTSTKRRSVPSPSSSADDVPVPPKRKKRLMPATPPDSCPSSSWEEHDLSAPDRTVPHKYRLSRHATQPYPHAYLGPDFLGATELDALSPRARERLLRPLRAPRLSFSSSPSASVGARPRASRRRAGRHEPLAVSDSDSGAEGPPRLAAGQAAKGVFLEGVAQTGFAGGAPGPAPAPIRAAAKARRERVRLQSVQDLGARFEERALRDAPREGTGAGGAPRRRARAAGAGKPRLWLGPEDEAGDVGELDERAVNLYITTARPLPPHRKPGARPPARPVHFRFAPIRRPPPAQLISLRPAHTEEDSSGAQLDAHGGGHGEAGEEVGSLDEAAARARSSRQRPPRFRFVVGARAKQSSECDLGGWDGAGAQAAEETPAPRAGGRPQPCTPSSAAPAPQSGGDVFLAGYRPLRRMSTYGESLFGPRGESDPLEDKETPLPPPPRTLEPVVGAPATPQSELRPEQDAHESSHSYRDGHTETPSLPVSARAAAGPTPPRTDPLALVTPSFSFPPAQQHGAVPHRLTPSRSPASTSSFDHSALAALHGTASSPLQAHYPPHLALLPGMATRTSSASTTGLALPIPLCTPYASFRYSSPPLVRSVSGVGPTMPDEEDEDFEEDERLLLPTEPFGARAEQEQEQEQVPPTSALGPPSPSGASEHVPSNVFDELDAAPGEDDDDAVEVHYTALAVAARTRRALEPARRATVAPQQRKAQTTAQGVLTPPESTRKPARRGGAARG